MDQLELSATAIEDTLLVHKQKVEEFTKQIMELPTLPGIVSQILGVANNENSSAADLERIILRDQSITANILKVANSAYFGFYARINTLSQAIVLLGFRTVISLALSTSVIQSFKPDSRSALATVSGLWRHGIACATAAKEVGKMLRYYDPETLFITGLLHDVGKVVLTNYFFDRYYHVLVQAQKGALPLYLVERECLGFDHAEVSFWLSSKWHFPESLSVPLGDHHNLALVDSRFGVTTAIIHVADVLASKVGFSSIEMPELDMAIDPAAISATKLNDAQLLQLQEKLEAQSASLRAFFTSMKC